MDPKVEENAASPTTGLEEIARRLAKHHGSIRHGGEPVLLARLGEWTASLHLARQYFAGCADQKLEIPPSAEWLLDNYYLIQQAIRQVRHDLPEGFYRLLPLLEGSSYHGLPRIYALAHALTTGCQIHLDPERIRRFVAAYQTVVTLTIGELWALPAMLRLATLERLNASATILLETAQQVNQSSEGTTPVREKANPSLTANGILDLRAIDIEDWKIVFETLSLVEQTLRRDPARVYERMDFETRDRYRKVIEEIARSTGHPEVVIAQQAIDLAAEETRLQGEDDRPPVRWQSKSHLRSVNPLRRTRRAGEPPRAEAGGEKAGAESLFSGRTGHVGFYLLDQGRATLVHRLGDKPSRGERMRGWFETRALRVYLGAIGLLTAILLGGMAGLGVVWGGSLFQVFLVLLVGWAPAMTIAVGLVHTVVPRFVRPHILPKMDFQSGIPDECRTLVVIPTLFGSGEEIEILLRQLEQHYLNTLDDNLRFALLTDFADAPQENMPGDEILLAKAREGILLLNQKYGTGQRTPFHLLHRARKWNPREGVWMGWERKRGKLVELSDFLSGAFSSSYSAFGSSGPLPPIRYVITLDADSLLTRGGARRLIAALAHPLNQAEFDTRSGALIAGYTILQPRVRVKPTNVTQTILTRLFAGDPGLDLYSQAVSDVYQDLFQEGSYVGKGIMDVAAFHRCLAGRVPENALLSHDLFEGILGRAGLVTDVVVLENFPALYLAFTERMHRWIRGDWQLLPWLLTRVPVEGGGRIPNDLSALDRWKIFDNLRRSLLAPSMLAFLLLGWLVLPGPAPVWTLLAILAPGASFLAGAALRLRLRLPGLPSLDSLRSFRSDLARWALALVFLPYEALLTLNAVGITLIRLTFTRRRLLEWIPAASIARFFGRRIPQMVTWQRMASAPVAALASALAIALVRPSSLPSAGVFLLAWLISPAIAQWISHPTRRVQAPLDAFQQDELRQLARRTWLFYESFVGPEDHWLPPDHFQESPRGQAAHHTSPTNIGFLLLSSLAANDLGYMGPFGLSLRLNSTLETLDQLERYRGHFLNWYDTRSLSPLPPRYVSTVDSGNLAGCLIALSQACLTLENQPVIRWQRWQGLLDALALLAEELAKAEENAGSSALQGELAGIRRQILAVEREPARWTGVLELLSLRELPKLDGLLMRLVESRPQSLSPDVLEGIRQWSERIRHHLMSMRREVELLLPWLIFQEQPPALFTGPDSDAMLQTAWRELSNSLPVTSSLAEVPGVCRSVEERVRRIQRALKELTHVADGGGQADILLQEAQSWCVKLAAALQSAGLTVESLLIGYRNVARRSTDLVEGMDFSFLFDQRQQVFHIGYNLEAGKLDENHYDLLASEARLASLVAIAKRDVPLAHWLYLGRPLTRVGDSLTLLSWSGTMFEYLMPTLLMRSYPGTLLDQSCRAAVRCQQGYVGGRNKPWGISESGYYAFDAGLNYQYRAFGVPALGLKRGLGDDLVITPYASLLALSLATKEVLGNLARFIRLGMVGQYGLYEALDCTRARMPDEKTQAVVRSYMAHHHGMIMVALVNALQDSIMIRRFHADPLIQTVELLLQEQLPVGAPVTAGPPVVSPVRAQTPQVSLTPWQEEVQAAVPCVHLLSNGRYGVLVTSAGSGYSYWQGLALTRWQADPTLEEGGAWIYVSDLESGSLLPVTFQPTASPAGVPQAFFYPYKAEFRRMQEGLALKLEVAVAAEEDLEIRHLILTNQSDRTRRLSVASYGEVVLAPREADRRHPAFHKMFLESEFLPELNALLFRRRPRSAEEEPVYLVHMLVTRLGARFTTFYESDRARFVGRGRTPQAPAFLADSDSSIPGTTGATLDPVMVLGRDLKLGPRATSRMAFLTLAGRSRTEVVALARRYHSLPVVDRVFGKARAEVERELRTRELSTAELESFDHLLSALLYPGERLRAGAQTLASNFKGQHGLWGFGISGDLPILLVRLKSEEETALVRDVLRAHAFWRRRGVMIDVVVLVEKESGYGQELQGELYQLMVRMESAAWLNQRGGIFLLSSDQMAADDRMLLETAARVILDGARGVLTDQLAAFLEGPVSLPAFIPTLIGGGDPEPTPPLPRPSGLLFDNGRGGFSPDGREYVIHLGPGEHTPKPWINVIANPRMGFTMSEAGAGCTWAENASENRLTPWSNDPVSDGSGEALYLRDEETAMLWSPTPQPAPDSAPYLVRHGAGYTVFEHQSQGLRQQVRFFLAPDLPVKVIAVRLENLWRRPRRLTATYYAQWVMGTNPETTAQFVVPEYEPGANAILARNPFNPEFSARWAFLAASQRPHGLTADRTEFLGRLGNMRNPAALSRVGLASAIRAGLDPCAAIQLHVELNPGEAKNVYFLLGEGESRQEAVNLAREFCIPGQMESAWQGTRSFWDDLLGAVTVTTPDPALDLMLNRWLPYQTLACRIWGRSALYQSGGAFGFRDQLQDGMALVHAAPAVTRAHILLAARHQFEEGDVLHWWHPPSGRGVRTRFSDDLLWLPFAVAQYVESTGDTGILAERVPFLKGEPLRPEEAERYALFERTPDAYPLMEHCRRALEKGATAGSHGLPLMGGGDWNDGLNRVGAGGRGESVWLGWFLHSVLSRFAALSERTGHADQAESYRRRAEEYRAAIEATAWDGRWYRRACYDDGEPIGAAENAEWRIDSLAQSWAVLSGAADPARAAQAMDEVMAQLVKTEDGLILLATPPFDTTPRDPGYIKGYPPGVRENGGVYVHAAIWTVQALFRLGRADEACALLRMLNPIHRSDTPEGAAGYEVEPYAVAADISSQPAHPGRGGWTWYTGSAGWMYRLGLEEMLGLHRTGDILRIAPCIPKDWPGFAIRYRYGRSTLHINAQNPQGVTRGVREIRLDGRILPDGEIPLVDDGAAHEVQILMG